MSFLSSVTNAVKKVGRAIRGGASLIIDLLKTGLNRVLGFFDFLGGLIGFLPKKKLRLRVHILTDEDGNLLVPEHEITPIVEFTKRVLKSQANIEVLAAYPHELIITEVGPTPAAALDVGCDGEAFLENLGEAGMFFWSRLARNFSGSLIGYAAPVTAFIVRNVSGKKGCSLGPLTDYVTVDLEGVETVLGGDDVSPSLQPVTKTLVHEIAHSCGLWHYSSETNLMYKSGGMGVNLTRFQKSFLRNSRHVTYF